MGNVQKSLESQFDPHNQSHSFRYQIHQFGAVRFLKHCFYFLGDLWQGCICKTLLPCGGGMVPCIGHIWRRQCQRKCDRCQINSRKKPWINEQRKESGERIEKWRSTLTCFLALVVIYSLQSGWCACFCIVLRKHTYRRKAKRPWSWALL